MWCLSTSVCNPLSEGRQEGRPRAVPAAAPPRQKTELEGPGPHPGRVDISGRPDEVGSRERVGGWEADTIIGNGRKAGSAAPGHRGSGPGTAVVPSVWRLSGPSGRRKDVARPEPGRTRKRNPVHPPFRHPGPSSAAQVPPVREGPGVRVVFLCPTPLLMEINQIHAVPMAGDDPDGRGRRPAAHGRREGDVRTARWYAVRDLQPLVEDSIERSWLQTP